MPRPIRILACVAVAGGALAPASTALACTSPSGDARCYRGDVLTVRGEHLSDVGSVIFLGRAGKADDRRARPVETSDSELSVAIPAGARSGRIRAVAPAARAAVTSPSKISVAPAPPKAAAPAPAPAPVTLAAGDGVFPIVGKHDMGQTSVNRFGGGRNHQGQDMFAACGTPLVAVRNATVTRAATEARAGNYVVLTDDAGQSYVYMHMAQPSPLRTGQSVAAGDPVGSAGQTGRATGCHLHFELWTAPGWYRGGKAVDPMPQLRRWDAAAGAH